MTDASPKLFDFECHYTTQHFLDVAANRTQVPRYDVDSTMMEFASLKGLAPIVCPQAGVNEGLMMLGQERIDAFAPHGIVRANISHTPGAELVEGEEGIALCRSLNDEVYANMQGHPDFYFGTMTLPVLAGTDAAIAEMERNAARGFRMWHTHSNYENENSDTAIDDECYRPLLARAAELGMLVYLHPTVSSFRHAAKYGYLLDSAALGFTVDVQAAILGLIVGGAFDDIPTLKVMLGHMAEGLPFTFGRIDRLTETTRELGGSRGRGRNQLPPSKYFGRNVFACVSGNFDIDSFELLVKKVGIDSVVFGSDFPFESLEDNARFVAQIRAFLGEEDFEKFAFRNGERLLRTRG